MSIADPQAPALRNRHGAPLGVLVVEDEAMVALLVQDMLTDLGCEIVGWAATADEAERLAATTPPDLVLMDIRLKGRRDGLAAAEALRQRHPMPVLFVTGMAREALLARAELLPRSAVLWKPFTMDALREALVRLCGG